MFILTSPSIHNGAFIVSSYALEKLVRLLRPSTRIFFDVFFSNGEKRVFNSLEKLLNIENSKRKQITRLILRAHSDTEDVSIDFNMKGRFGGGTIFYRVTNREGVQMPYAEEIVEVLEGLVPWYSFLTWLGNLWLIAVPFLVFGVWVLPATQMVWSVFHQTDWLVWVVVSRLILPLIASLLIGYGMSKFWNWTFPIGVFQVGQEWKRGSTREMFQATVVLSLPVSVVAGLLTNFFV